MADADDPADDGPTDRELRELLRAEHHRAAVEDRRRRQELQRQAVETRSLLDVLRALTGTATLVAVHTRRGLAPPSTVVEVGRDYVATRSSGPRTRIVPSAAIASVRLLAPAQAPAPTPTPTPTSGSGPTPAPGVGLHERLTELALRRPTTTVRAAGFEGTGRLTEVGLDVLTITGADGCEVLVALGAVDELVV